MKTSLSKFIRSICFFASVWLLASSLPAQAQAFCSIRQPYAVIQSLFPDIDKPVYRSFMRDFSKESAEKLRQRHQLEFDIRELGTHDIYAVFDQNTFRGVAHSRTEQADYGLAEVIVATDENLKLKDFSFQRCRSRYRKQFESESIRSAFRGKTSVELSAMLQPEAVDRFLATYGLEPRAEPLLRAILVSSIKTLVLIESEWGEDLAPLKP